MINRYLNEEHEGSIAIESTILMPLMFGTFLLLMYFLFMILAYIAYGNIANSIAHEMNMRQSGYIAAVEEFENGPFKFPTINSYKMSSDSQNRYVETESAVTLTENEIICHPDNKYVRYGLYSAIDRTSLEGKRDGVADQFIIPYAQVKTITVKTSKPLDFDSGLPGSMIAANTSICVEIDFTMMNPLGVFNWASQNSNYNSLINIKAIGYSIIA